MADWADGSERLCLMCTYEHTQTLKRVPGTRRKQDSVEWTGPTKQDLYADSDDESSLIKDHGSHELPWGYSVVE